MALWSMWTKNNGVMALTLIPPSLRWICVLICVSILTCVVAKDKNAKHGVIAKLLLPHTCYLVLWPSCGLRWFCIYLYFFKVGPKRWCYWVLWLDGVFWCYVIWCLNNVSLTWRGCWCYNMLRFLKLLCLIELFGLVYVGKWPKRASIKKYKP